MKRLESCRKHHGQRLVIGFTQEVQIQRVLVAQRALRIGFTLAELEEALKARDAGGVPCQQVYGLARQKLSIVTADIAALVGTGGIIECDGMGHGERGGHCLRALQYSMRSTGCGTL